MRVVLKGKGLIRYIERPVAEDMRVRVEGLKDETSTNPRASG
jgi:hypothetical protein